MPLTELGSGFFFKTYPALEDGNVYKIAKLGRRGRGKFGEAFADRMQHDINLLQSRFPGVFVAPTIYNSDDMWWLEQVRINSEISLSHKTATPALMDQALKIIEETHRINKETGFIVDLLGHESVALMPKYAHRDFWQLPGMFIEGTAGAECIRIVDSNLIWTGRVTEYFKSLLSDKTISPISILPIEPAVSAVHERILGIVESRITEQLYG